MESCGNHIDNQGVLDLIVNLKFYPNIVDIDLHDNPANKESLTSLKKCLKQVSLLTN